MYSCCDIACCDIADIMFGNTDEYTNMAAICSFYIKIIAIIMMHQQCFLYICVEPDKMRILCRLMKLYVYVIA